MIITTYNKGIATYAGDSSDAAYKKTLCVTLRYINRGESLVLEADVYDNGYGSAYVKSLNLHLETIASGNASIEFPLSPEDLIEACNLIIGKLKD